MKVTFFHRRPSDGNYSIEGLFNVLRCFMDREVECRVLISRFVSKGIFKRVFNIFEAVFYQGDINHVTGDVHFLTYLLRKRKTILTIHDCVILYNTNGIRQRLLKYFWYIIPEKRVALITVVSESTKVELLKMISCDPKKIVVVPNCISDRFTRKDKKFNKEKPIILQVGTGKNKNLLRVIEAVKGIPCLLMIIGRMNKDQKDALSKNNVDFYNAWDLTEEDVVSCYETCDILTFVSTYEGFGMPILEANAVGRAVITSNLMSMPEVAGGAASIVNPYSINEIRSAILKIISDESYRGDLVRKGYVNVSQYRPEIVSGMYLKQYQMIFQANEKKKNIN